MFFSRPTGITALVAFLGNPGTKYNFTRHNAGFITCDAVEKKLGVTVNRSRFHALTADAAIGPERVLLMKPQTFMNLSGEAVGEAARFYKIPPEKILVVSDEMSLPVGRIRFKPKGSAGGHNGLKNIIEHLGTDAFPRIRLGVGAPPSPEYDVKDWVLSVFRNQDAVEITAAADRAADAVCSYFTEGAEKTMNRFNGI